MMNYQELPTFIKVKETFLAQNAETCLKKKKNPNFFRFLT